MAPIWHVLALVAGAALLWTFPAQATTKLKVEVQGDRFTVIVNSNKARAMLSEFYLDPDVDWRKARIAVEKATGCVVIDTSILRNIGGRATAIDALIDCPKRKGQRAILPVGAAAEARTKAKAVVEGVEYSVTVKNGEALASRTGLRLWSDRVGDWRKAVTAIEQVSGCTAQHVTVIHAHNGGVPVGVRALLDCQSK